MTNVERIVFRVGDHGCAGLHHRAAPDREARDGVLIVPPFAWEEVASYRPRRRLAERLAAAGHPTIRYDLPGTGDSSGGPASPDLLDAWVGSIGAGAAWMRERGSSRVAVVGLGLGGLLARECVARGGAIDDLVLWASPASGRFFVRELKALSRMQTDKGTEAEERLLPEGWIDLDGFIVSAETLASLGRLAPPVPAGSGLRRALLLARDGVGMNSALAAELREASVKVREDAGAGWGGMVNHPERSALPAGTTDLAIAWLRESEQFPPPSTAAATAPGQSVGSDRLVVECEGREVVETAFLLQQDSGRMFGILSEPVAGPVAPVCAVLLNAGAIPHTGPHRMWVEIARHAAAVGVPTLRVDLMSIGESDGDESMMRDIESFYQSNYEGQITAVLDALDSRGVGRSFFVSGLCAGAYWAARAGLCDPRVGAVVMLNGGALAMHEHITERQQSIRLKRAFSLDAWRRFLPGSTRRSTPKEVVAVVTAAVRYSLRMLWARRSRKKQRASPIAVDLDKFDKDGTRLVLAFSAGETLAAELAEDGIFDRLADWPSVEIRDLPGTDHSLRPLEARRAALDLMSTEIDRLVPAEFAQTP
jgi:alpha-beta hydrolase superfamily lysophospholipase